MWVRSFTISLFVFGVQLSTPLWGSPIYVDGTLASDCNGNYSIASRNCTGSDGDAYNTIQEAENATSAGDTVHIRAGTYKGKVQFKDNNGTAGNPITFQSHLSETVTLKFADSCNPWIDPGGICGPLFDLRSVDYLVFDGMDFDGEVTTNCPTGSACASSRANYQGGHVGIATKNEISDNVTVRNCTFTGFAHAGVKGDVRGWTIEYNIIHDIGLDNQDHGFYGSTFSNGIVRYNHIYNITGYIFHLWSTSAALPVGAYQIYYNVAHDYGLSPGNTGASCVVQRGDNLEFYGNVCDTGPRGVTSPRDGNTGWVVRNNIFMNISRNVIVIERTENLFAAFENNYYGSSGSICSGCANPNNVTYDDVPPNVSGTPPTFVVATPSDWDDYRTAPGSITIDAGANLAAEFDDALSQGDTVWPPSLINQDLYGTGWEIGPFIFLDSSSSNPASPKNLRTTAQ